MGRPPGPALAARRAEEARNISKPKLCPKLGDSVLYRNDSYPSPETPRHAVVNGLEPSGVLHLHVFRHAIHDVRESNVQWRPNVPLLDTDESPGRMVREWCYYGEYSLGEARRFDRATIPLAGPPGEDDDEEYGAPRVNLEDE